MNTFIQIYGATLSPERLGILSNELKYEIATLTDSSGYEITVGFSDMTFFEDHKVEVVVHIPMLSNYIEDWIKNLGDTITKVLRKHLDSRSKITVRLTESSRRHHVFISKPPQKYADKK
jgi:hypothetical protein